MKTEIQTVKSHDIAAVQSKETLQLDYNPHQQYSKRKLVSNWDRYAEQSDESDSEQVTASDFEQILLASKSVGEHFTFSAEQDWQQSVERDAIDKNSTSFDLFKLDISKLKKGVAKLPFYIKHGLSKNEFSEDEITKMDHGVQYFEKLESKDQHPFNENLLNIIRDSKSTDNQTQHTQQANNELNSAKTKAQSTKAVLLSNQDKQKLNDTQGTEATESKSSTSIKKVQDNKVEDIQDWLDDILNEK